MIDYKTKNEIEILITSKKTYREISKMYNGMSFTTIKKIKDSMNNYHEKYREFIKIKAIRKILDLPEMYGYFDDITQNTINELIKIKDLLIKHR